MLILLAVKERRVWVEVGYGLEQWITDGFAGETSRQVMVPEFRAGRYGAGLRRGTERIIGRIAQGRDVTLDGVPRAARRARQRDSAPIPIWLIIRRLHRAADRQPARRRSGGVAGSGAAAGAAGRAASGRSAAAGAAAASAVAAAADSAAALAGLAAAAAAAAAAGASW